MLYYARSDTHYLLFIYDSLRNLLLEHPSSPGGFTPIQKVISSSEQTALRVWDRETYDSETGRGVNGWAWLIKKYARHLTGPARAVVVAVHEWRDRVARELDESTKWVGFVVGRSKPVLMKGFQIPPSLSSHLPFSGYAPQRPCGYL